MQGFEVPAVLEERLGAAGTLGLNALIEASKEDCMHAVTERLSDRIERRLSEEAGRLSGEMNELRHNLRLEMSELRLEMASVRHDMTAGDAALRQELTAGLAAVRQEMGGLRHDMATIRFDLLKWSFLFWVGQVLAVGGILSFVLRRG